MSKAAKAKAIERAKLLERKTVTLTFEADEETMQRIAALLQLAKVPYDILAAPPLPPLPWEDPADARYQKLPELEVDCNAVRNEIMAAMRHYLRPGGALSPERAREHLTSLIGNYGGTRLTDVPNDNLLALLGDLNDLNAENEP